MKKRLTSTILACIMALSLSVSAFAAASEFTDVSSTHWAHDSINWCAEQNIVNGIGNGAFAPNDTLTGAQFSVMLARAFYAESVADIRTDADNWYTAEVKTLSAAGIYDCDDSALIANYNAGISRYQMAQMMFNIVKDCADTDIENEASSIVTDTAANAQYADAVSRCVAIGLLKGYDDGKFHGEDTLTRAQAATVIYRLYLYIEENNIVVPEVDFGLVPDDDTLLIAANVVCASPFPASEVAYALDGAEDGTMSKAEARMYAQCGRTQRSYNDSNTKICTTGEFLDMLETSLEGKLFHRSGSGFVCPTVNSWWMSAEEWDALTSDLSAPVTRGTALVMAIRIGSLYKTLDEVPAPDTVENFMRVTYLFCPDYLDELVYPCDDAVEYWYNYGSFKVERYTSVFHELQHEANARKRDAFVQRIANGTTWCVRSYSTIQNMWYFEPETSDWTNLSFDKNLPKSMFVVSDMPSICAQIGRSKYITGSQSSNNNGVSGMLNEFSSVMTEMRIYTAMASAGYGQNEDTMSNILLKYYFWRGATLSYMDGLQSAYPDQYNKLITNQDFVNLLVQFIDYGEKLIGMEPGVFVYGRGWNSYIDTMIAWSNAHESQLAYLRTLTN